MIFTLFNCKRVLICNQTGVVYKLPLTLGEVIFFLGKKKKQSPVQIHTPNKYGW